jgi:hypothetical protein
VHGTCGLADSSKAAQWRMPNLNELESLIDVSASAPALPAGNQFANVSDGIYWTSTSYFGGEGSSPKAWCVRLSDVRYMNDTSSNVKASASNAVWAGRDGGSGDDGSPQAGVAPTFPRWVDNGNGTISHTVTGLVGLKRADCINGQWPDALAAVNALASGQCGLTDNSVAGAWRMPNRHEMLSLSDRMETNHADFFNHIYTTANPMLNHALFSRTLWCPILLDLEYGRGQLN